MAYQNLSTQKYWEEKAIHELKVLRRQQGLDAMQAFRGFLCCLTIITATFFAYTTMPEWLPQVSAFLESSDLANRFMSGLGKVQAWFGV